MVVNDDTLATARAWRGVPVPLIIVLACFLILGLIYARLIPPFEGPDEAQHFAYVVWLAEGNGLPPRGPESWQTPLQQEAGQPPLYYALAAVPARLVGTSNPEAVYHENPYFTGPFPRELFDNDNRALHYQGEGQPLRGGWLAFYLARGLSLLFGMALIVAVYALTLRLFPRTPSIALGAACLVAFTPQVIYISSMVSNDIPAAALSAIALWFYSYVLIEDSSRKSSGTGFDRRTGLAALLTGIAIGLAGMTKISGLLIIAPAGVGIIWLGASGRRSWRSVLSLLVLLGVGASLAAGWWFLAGLLRGESATGLTPHYSAPWANDETTKLTGFVGRWREVGRSTLAALGWGTIRLDDWMYALAALFALLVLLGWAITFARWRRGAERPQAGVLAMLFVLALNLLVTGVFLEVWMHRVVAPYGRLLFPAITSIAVLMTLGWRAVHPRLPFVGSALLLALAIAIPFLLIVPAYTPPPLRANLPEGIGWRFAEDGQPPFAELVSITPASHNMGPEAVMPVEMCWRALGKAGRDYAVVLQLIGPDNALLSSRRTTPGQGMRPTSQWQPGQAWCEWVHIKTPETVDRTLVYRLELFLFDDFRDKRLEATDAAGAHLPHGFIDAIRVEANQVERVERWEGTDPLQLLDHSTTTEWRAGANAPLALRWGVAQSVDRDLQLYVHLRDSSSGEMIAQFDGPPLGGSYPTSWWEQDEVVVDERTISLPSTVAPGDYSLHVGWYDLVSGERVGSDFDLGTIRVMP